MRWLVAGSLCLLAAALSAGSASEPARPDFRVAVQKARESVVLVESYMRGPGGTGPGRLVANTGFFVTDEGHVLTSLLAVSGSTRIRVQPAQGEPAEAEIWALDQASGLALLKTDLRHTTAFEHCPELPEPGAWVVAACATKGPEGGADVAVAAGILSSSKVCVKLSGVRWDGLLRAELMPREGLASGPVMDPNGRLVGVVLGARTLGAASGGCCYALPAAALDPILSQLKEGKNHRLGWLGLAVACSPGKEGLTVRGVLGGSPAHAAGIQPGDILLALDGDVIRESGVFESKVGGMTPGGSMELQVLRGKELKTVSVQVGARPLLISRMPVRTGPVPGLEELWSRTTAAEFGLYATDRRIISELQQENRELRQRIEELEQRLETLEGKEGDD